MQIQIPTADVKSALAALLSNSLSAQQQLGQEAAAQVQRLVDDLYPLVVSQTQSLLTATNPAVPQTYLQILSGCVEASIARLGLSALATERAALAQAAQTGVQILAMLLKAAVAV